MSQEIIGIILPIFKENDMLIITSVAIKQFINYNTYNVFFFVKSYD